VLQGKMAATQKLYFAFGHIIDFEFVYSVDLTRVTIFLDWITGIGTQEL
jgi:hypothetical protein